eukprot:CCRYP_019443-RA/>CCRYP_019443-RA protein AED:0.45 eAED:0.45 QI:0/-1/0/1/-1/1/1/0/158
MTAEEITTIFAMAATMFQPISGQPNDDNLTALCNILYPLLLDIQYDEDSTYNLMGLIEPSTLYKATWGGLHSLCIPSSTMRQLQWYERAKRLNMPSWSVTLPPMKRPNEQQQNSSVMPLTRSGIVTSATIDHSTHTSRQKNSSRTSTTTAVASTPASL